LGLAARHEDAATLTGGAATRPNVVVFTATDSRFFVGTVALLNSLRLTGSDWEIVAFDGGLTREQRQRLAPHMRIESRPEHAATGVGSGKDLVATVATEGVAVWIDSDIVMLRPFDDLIAAARQGSVCAAPDADGFRRFRTEWQEHFDLRAPLRRRTYVNAGFFVLSVDEWPGLLRRFADLSPKVPEDVVFAGDKDDNPLWAGDQDLLNALMMSEFRHVDLKALEKGEMMWSHGPAVQAGARGAQSPGAEAAGARMIHFAWTPKPWQSGGWKRREAPVATLRRYLFGDGLVVTLAPGDVPLWLRPDRVGHATRASVTALRAVYKTVRPA
jgi:hypothetical protein